MKTKEKAAPRQESSLLNTQSHSTTNRLTLRQQFINDFACSAFQNIDGEQCIVGKCVNIVQMDDGSFDAWFVGRDLQPLTPHKVTAIAKKCPQEWHLTLLDGEAYARGRGREFVLLAASLGGVKRKRQLSTKTRQNLSERMTAMNHG